VRQIFPYSTRSLNTISLHRSQILRDLWAMQAQAAESSGYAGQFRCFFGKKNLKTVCSDSFMLNQALKQACSACLRAF